MTEICEEFGYMITSNQIRSGPREDGIRTEFGKINYRRTRLS